MEFISGVFSNVTRFAANLNTSTLSGAIDIVFVQQLDGTYRSTPFYVKFGKIGVLQAKEKVIYIEVNGEEIEKTMVLDDNGVAYFDDPGVNMTKRKKKELSGSRRLRRNSEPTDSVTAMVTPFRVAANKMQSLPVATKNMQPYHMLSTASRALSHPHLDLEGEEGEEEPVCVNQLTLTQDEMRQFNLTQEINEAVFSVTTQFQGTTRCCCSIFVWDQSARIIISDIDGTITKSDVRGMILPLMGLTDWAQREVTELFTRISNNGYKILYLSARSISQAGATRDYIRGLVQGSLNLPVGPLFLNPESVFKAFKKEVIDRQPEVFKISCLQRLKDLFDGETPFFAGYGNRPNDIVAYETVGIPKSRIFIINKTGELKGSINETMRTSYKCQSTIVDLYYPPTGQSDPADPNYWVLPLCSVQQFNYSSN